MLQFGNPNVKKNAFDSDTSPLTRWERVFLHSTATVDLHRHRVPSVGVPLLPVQVADATSLYGKRVPSGGRGALFLTLGNRHNWCPLGHRLEGRRFHACIRSLALLACGQLLKST